MANNTVPADLSFKKHLSSSSKVINNEEDEEDEQKEHDEQQQEEEVKVVKPIVSNAEDQDPKRSRRKRLQSVAVSRLMRSVLTILARNRRNMFSHHHQDGRLGTRVVVGTLFGFRHGHVHLSFQKDPAARPVFLVELATPTSGLVREMASGLVRIALECDKDEDGGAGPAGLLDRPGPWRTYCNGKKCGFAARREAGDKEWEVLKAVGPISMGAGVLPPSGNGDDGGGGEVMYMRAKFERVVGSRDSEAFYMVNPDSNAAPELSIYLLRV